MHTLRGGKISLIHEDGTQGTFFKQNPQCNKIKIGSSIICDVRIHDAETRKVHCIIFVDKTSNVIKIKNVSKKTPTLLNGVPVKKYHILNNRDTITIVKRKFLWTYVPPNNSNRVLSGTEANCVKNITQNIELQVDNMPETKDGGATQPEKTSIMHNNKKGKKIDRRVTCKINKIPIGNIGKRLKAHKRITIHELRGGENIEDSSLEQTEEISEDSTDSVTENKTENTITPIVIITETHDPEKSIEDIDIENENITISHSMVKCNNTTPLKDITRLQEKNIMTTPKGHHYHSMFPLEVSTPFQTFENKHLSLAKLSKLEKSDSLVWSVSPATLSYREKHVAKSFTSTLNNHSTRVVNELIDVDLLDNTVIKKTISSSMYLIDLTTPDASNLNISQRTPNKSVTKSSTLLKSAIKNSSVVLTKTPKSFLHTIAKSTIKKIDRSPMVTSSVKKVLNMTNTKTTDTNKVGKNKTLFLNKSLASYSTKLCEQSKTLNLSLSTINKRKTVNLLESSARNDKAIEVQVGGISSAILLRKSMGNTTPAKSKKAVKDRIATLGCNTTDHSEVKVVTEVLKKQAQQFDQTDELSDIIKDKQQFNVPVKDELINVDGVHKSMKTPIKHILSNDCSDVTGITKLLNTPVLGDFRDVCGVNEIMKTPVKDITINDSTVAGSQELMNTPADDLREVGGVDKMMTPNKHISTNDLSNVSEIKEANVSICTLPSIDIPPDTLNIEDFEEDDDKDDDTEFNEDFVSKNTSLDENKSMDQTFDELVGKKTITKTYSRKKSVTPEKRNLTEFQTENIEKWVESVVNVGIDEVQPKPNNNQQILSNRYSNVTPQTSVVEPIGHINENDVSDEDDDSDKESSQNSEAESAFKKTAITDLIDPCVSFRFENYDLSFASESDKSEVATQMPDIPDESALLNEEAEYIIPSTQQERTPRRLTRAQHEANASNCNIDDDDSKDTFIIEDDVIIPETQVEVFQEDVANDNDFLLEMSSQALETNISLVLNGEEEILTTLVDNQEDDSSSSCIIEDTQMPQNEKECAIVAKNDSSILFIDDTIFMDKSKATPTSKDSDRDTDVDDSSIILCDDDSVNIQASHLHRTRSKSETPKKIDRFTSKTTRKTMGDTLNKSIELSKFPLNTVVIDKYSNTRNDKSATSVKKQDPLKSSANNESNDVIDLSESFGESLKGSADSDDASSDQLDDNLESEISGIEPLQEESSCVLVYENSDDEIISGVFDHLEKNMTVNASELQEINKSASQSMVDKGLQMNSEVLQNVSNSTKTSPKRRKTVGDLSAKEVSKNSIELENKSASQMMVEECLEMDADVFQNFHETDIVRDIRGASLSPIKIAKPSKPSRKTVGDHLDVKDDVASKFGVDINNINLAVGDIDKICIANTNTGNNSVEELNVKLPDVETELSQPMLSTLCGSSAIKDNQLRMTRSKSQTPNKQTSKMPRKTLGDSINEKTDNISKYQQEVNMCSNNLNVIEHLTIPCIKSKSVSPQKQSPKSPSITNKSVAVIDLDYSDDPSMANDMSSLIYIDSDDEMMDSVFDNLEHHPTTNDLELENKSVSQAISEECFEMHSEIFQNFDENPNVRQARGASLTPVKNLKSNFKTFRKTMGDKLEVKENCGSKFESVNNISPSVGNDINEVRATTSRSVMNIDNKTKSPQSIHNKTVSEIDCEKLVIESSVCSESNCSVKEDNTSVDNAPQFQKIEKLVNKTVTSISVNENNLNDTFEQDESENLFSNAEKHLSINDPELENKSASHAMAEECLVMNSEVFQNFDENPNVRQTRGTSLTPVKNLKPNFKLSRKTMGDKLEMKEKVISKFESEVNNISLSVNDDINRVLATTRRRAMSIDNKTKLPQNIHIKTVSEIDCEKVVIESSVCSQSNCSINEDNTSVDNAPQSQEIEKLVNKTVISISVNDTFEQDESENLFSDAENHLTINDPELENKSASHAMTGECLVMHSEVFQNFDENPNVRQARGASLTPVKKQKSNFKLSRKTMGDKLEVKEKLSSKFETEVNNITLSVNDEINHVPATTHRRAMSIDNKTKSPKNFHNKTVSEIDCEKLVIESSVCSQSNCSVKEDNTNVGSSTQSHEIEKLINKTVIVVNENVNSNDTFEQEKSENLISDAEMFPTINDFELEHKSISQAMPEVCLEMHSELFQNYVENPNVQQARGTSLTPVKNLKPNFKLSRKTMGDKLEEKDKVISKFESEINNISLSINDDINEVQATTRPRAMSFDNKTKLPKNMLNKTVSEIDCEKLFVVEPTIRSQSDCSIQGINKSVDNSPQSHEIEKLVNKTVTVILVNENENLDDTFEHDESENLFDDEESEMFIPETQEIPIGTDFIKNSQSIVIIPETQPDPHEISMSDLENSQPEKSIQNRSSQLHKLSLNSPNQTKSPRQIKSQSSLLDELPKMLNVETVKEVIEHAEVENTDKVPLILDENIVVVENVEVIDNNEVVKTGEVFGKVEVADEGLSNLNIPAKRKRRLYSKETYNPVFDYSYDCAKGFLNNPTSTPVSKSGNVFDVINISKDAASSSEQTLIKNSLVPYEILEVENEALEKSYVKPTEDEEQPTDINYNANDFKIGRRVNFADKPEEKYFEVLSEYEESIKQPVRGRRPLLSSKSDKNNKIKMLELSNEIKTSGRGRRRGAQTQNEAVKKISKIKTDVIDESETNLQVVSSLEIEAIPVIEDQVKNSEKRLEQNSGRGKNRPQPEKKNEIIQKILVEDIEEIPIVEENTSNEHLEQKTSARGRGRRATKKKIEMSIETNKDDENETAKEQVEEEITYTEPLEPPVLGRSRSRRAPAKKKVEVVSGADNKNIEIIQIDEQEVHISDEQVEQKAAGRGRSRRLAKKAETEMINEILTEEKKEIKTKVLAVSTKDKEATLVVEKDIISNEHIEEKMSSRGKGRRAPAKKKIAVASETVIDDKNEISSTIQSEEIEVIPDVAREIIVSQQVEQKKTGRGKGRRGLIKKQEIEIISETNTEDGTNDQVVLAKDTELISTVEEIVKNSIEKLEPINVEVKTSIRERGRRALPKNKEVEIISETKIDNINEIATDVVQATHEGKNSVDAIDEMKSESKLEVLEILSEETDGNKIAGRNRRHGQIQKNIELNIESIDKDATTSALEEMTGNKSVGKRTTGRRTKKNVEVISNDNAESKLVESTTTDDHSDSHLNAPEKTGRGKVRKQAANKKNLDQETDESMKSVTLHEEEKIGRGRHRGAVDKKHIEVELTNTDDLLQNIKVVNANIHVASAVEEVFATPTKPAVRLRRLGTKRYVTDSESEQVPESSTSEKKRRLIKKPSRYLDETTSDADASSTEQINEKPETPSRSRKVVATKPPKLETPVKSRSRRGIRQAIEAENENVINTPAKEVSLVASHEGTTSKSAASENDNKIETPIVKRRGRPAKPLSESNTSLGMVKEDTPLKSRGRRAATAPTEKLTIPAKRGRNTKHNETSELELSATDILITNIESSREPTSISTKTRSHKAADESSKKQTRLRKAKEEPNDEVSSSTKAESPKVSRVKRSRAK